MIICIHIWLAVTQKKHKAIEIARNENEYRGGKYQCRIYETDINWTWNENNISTVEVKYD